MGEIAEIDEKLRRAWNGVGPPARSAGRHKRHERGAMKKLVLRALEEAGPGGIPAKDLAAKLKVKPLHLHAWLNMTGKRNGLVEAVTRGVYRLAQSPPSEAKKTNSSARIKKVRKPRKSRKTAGK